jgi:ferredoxin
MLKDIIDFYWFSGTGNTLNVVKKMKEVFEKNGKTVNLIPIEKTKPEDINLDHTVGLGFTVAVFGTYPFVWDFIKALPKTKDTAIFMVDTMGGNSGGLLEPIRRIVKRKGYIPIGATQVIMPNNLMNKTIDEEKNATLIQAGLETVEKYVIDLLKEKAVWKRENYFMSTFISIMSRAKISWWLMRVFMPIKVNKAKCKKCGLCVKLCPVDNLEMDEYPKAKKKCVICVKCTAFCPTGAIYMMNEKIAQYKSVDVKEMQG